MTDNSTNMELDIVLEEQFRSMDKTLTRFRSEITSMQQQLRAMEKNVKRDFKSIKKSASKYNKPKGNNSKKPSGFAIPSKISAELCEFMGKKEGSQVARTEVTQFIIGYIKENKLGESKDIVPDDKLRELLNIKDDESLTYFNLQKYMNKHFIKDIKIKQNV